MGLMDDVDEVTFGMAFTNPDGFPGVETFKYHRHGAGVLNLTGPVYRDPPQFDLQRGDNVRRIRVFVSKSQLTAVDCPGDAVEIAFDLGGKVEKHAVKQILNQDAGGWELLLG